jgi:hypothetical protein
MGLFDFFRRPPPIRDVAALAEFIDGNAAFLVQKGIYEYARARAGHYSKVLLAEEGFLKAVEQARWQAYPLGLAMVGEMAEGLLRPSAGDDRRALVDTIGAVVLDVFDSYPLPSVPGGRVAWQDRRVELARRLNLIGAHARKPVKDIPEPYVQAYFDLMPIYERLRAPDFQAIRNYLRVGLINIHDVLSDRLDVPAVLADLLKQRPE